MKGHTAYTSMSIDGTDGRVSGVKAWHINGCDYVTRTDYREPLSNDVFHQGSDAVNGQRGSHSPTHSLSAMSAAVPAALKASGASTESSNGINHHQPQLTVSGGRSSSAPVMASSYNGSSSTTGSDSVQSKTIPDKELIPMSPKKTRKDRFHKLFPDLSDADVLIKSYHCAFVGDILLQGFLYITENWFCFYSKLLGKKRIKISVANIVSITKKKTALIIPNAVGIYTDKDQYVFGSLMSRDNTHRVLYEVWQQNRLGLKQSSLADADNGLESAIDRDSIANASLNTVSSLSSSDDFVASSSSDDNFLSDAAGSCDKLHLMDSSSISELCHMTSTSDTSCAVGLMSLTSDFDENSHIIARSKSLFNKQRCFSPFSRLYHGVRLKNYVTSLGRVVTWLTSLPRTSLFLLVSTILVFFLLLSAGLLTYRLLHLQAQLDLANLHGWPIADAELQSADNFNGFELLICCHTISIAKTMMQSNQGHALFKQKRIHNLSTKTLYQLKGSDSVGDVYRFRREYQMTTVQQMHQVLEAHVHLLDQVNEALKGLYTWALKSGSMQSPHAEQATDHHQSSLPNDVEL